MDTVTAVKNRILELCGEHDISINKLASVSALPPSSVKNILYGKSQNPKLLTIKMILLMWNRCVCTGSFYISSTQIIFRVIPIY